MNAPAELEHWPAWMKATTARAYLDGMSAEKFQATVAPFVQARKIGDRYYYDRAALDAFMRGPIGGPSVDAAANPEQSPSPRELIERVGRDLAERKGRQARRRQG